MRAPSTARQHRPRPLGAVLVVLLIGCQSAPEMKLAYPALDSQQTFQRLVVDSEFGAVDDMDVLAVSDALAAYIDTMRRRPDVRQRLEEIADLFRENGDLAMRYRVDATLSASQAFEQRKGNCLTYTHLFIAIARYLDMRVRYQEVLGRG